MVSKPPFQFFFRKDASTYYKVLGNFVVETATATPLSKAPDGWADIQRDFERNPNKHGIFTAHSNAYRFVQDGAQILRHVFYVLGKAGKCQLEIRLLNHTTQLYELYMIGDVDMNKPRDEESFFGITLLESGLTAMLKAAENTEYEIPILDTDPELIKVRLRSMKARGEATWVTTFPPTADPGHPHTAYPPYVNINFYPFPSMSNVDVKQIVADTNVVPITASSQGVNGGSLNFVFKTMATLYELKMSGTLKFSVNNTTGSTDTLNLRWQLLNASGTTIGTSPTVFSGSVLANQVTTFNNVVIDKDLTAWYGFAIPPDHTVRLIANMPSAATIASDYNWEPGRIIQASWLNYTPEIKLKGYRYWTIFKKLIQKITAGSYPASSTLLTNAAASYVSGLDNRPWDSIVTSGDGIRGIANAVIKVKLSDLFKDSDVRWSTGLDTNSNIASLEKKSAYYDATGDPIFLGPAANVVVEADEGMIYTDIKIGYVEQTYEEVMGRDEFNTVSAFKTPILAASNTLDLVSPWRSDMMGIFFTWTKYVQSATKDSPSDNDVFVIEIGPTPDSNGFYSTLSLGQTTPTTGVADPANAFNFGFSPMHDLKRAGAYIRSNFYGLDAEYLTYQTTDKNADLQTNLAAGIIKEKTNVQIGSLAPALYWHFVFLADIAASPDLANQIMAAPHKEYYTTWKGRTYRGFLMKASVKGAHKDKFIFTLRSSTKNDIAALVHR